MSHASHQALEQRRREQRHADLRDKPASKPDQGQRADRQAAGTAPAAPPRHEDEAFDVSDGNSPQSDG